MSLEKINLIKRLNNYVNEALTANLIGNESSFHEYRSKAWSLVEKLSTEYNSCVCCVDENMLKLKSIVSRRDMVLNEKIISLIDLVIESGDFSHCKELYSLIEEQISNDSTV